MVKRKWEEASSNQESILMAMGESDRPVSSRELEKYLQEQAINSATENFERSRYLGEVNGQNKDSYVKEHGRGIDLRTIQRALKTFLKEGFVTKEHNKYVLSIMGKRELQFREYSQAYGTISLNQIMDFIFPTINTLDKNLVELVKVFGVYVVYVLIEATRLIVANKKGEEEHWHSSFFGDSSNFREGKFREARLVSSWIKDVFNPWYMLNMFLTTISNSSSNGEVLPYSTKELETLIKQRLKVDLPPRINGVTVESILNSKTDNQRAKLPPSTLDLIRIRSISDLDKKNSRTTNIRNEYWQYFNIRTLWCNESNLLYEPDSETIEKLKDYLDKRYPVYSKCLQKINELFYSK